MAVITLLTDFGTQDSYVGEMKGVVLGIDPSATIVDISHSIRPQDIIQAAFMVHSAYAYFPERTIHVIVVDPGVGSHRKIIGAKLGSHTFMAPNNGVLTLIFAEPDFEYAVYIESSQYYLKPLSQTFHGRDIFAPISAHLSLGIDLQSLGPVVSTNELVTLTNIRPDISFPNQIIGRIVSVDHFGNLITNIDWPCIKKQFAANNVDNLKVEINQKLATGLTSTYANVSIQQPVVLIGSHGYLEIAVNQGNAQKFFDAAVGNAVHLWVDHI